MTERVRLEGANICIVMLSALGDIVHVLPVVHALKRHAPDARITWVLERAGASLIRGHPLVDEIIEHGKGFNALRSLRQKVRGRKFDLLIDLQVALKAGLATSIIPATIKLGFDRARARDLNWIFTNRHIPAHAGQHVQDQYLEFLSYLGVPAEPLQWMLGPWPGEQGQLARVMGQLDHPIVALTLASSVQQRDWIVERWCTLADALFEQHGLQPVLVGGKSERENAIASEIMNHVRAPVVSTLGCSLRELVGVLHAAALVISPDTAPVHMAVAMDIPVIALNGFTNPRRTGPYRKFQDLLVDAYGNPGEAFSASQEYREGRMERIAVEDVLEKVRVWERVYRSRLSR